MRTIVLLGIMVFGALGPPDLQTFTLPHTHNLPPPTLGLGPMASFSSIFGRTDLIIAASKAKNYREVDGDVRFPVDPPKLAQNDEKRCPTQKKTSNFFFRRKLS